MLLKFIISLASFIQILIYYLFQVLLITFIATLFISFFCSKIFYNFNISSTKKKAYYKIKIKIKGMDFCYKKENRLFSSFFLVKHKV